MKKLVVIILLAALNQQLSAQRAVDQLDLSAGLSLPLPSSYESDDDFDPALPTEPPPPSVDIVRPDENKYFPLSGLSKSYGSGIPYLAIVLEESKKQSFDPEMVLAIIKKESSFNPRVRSSAGAIGLMQLMPDTARWLGLKDTSKLYDPTTNIRYGIKYLRYLFSQFCEDDFSSLSKDDIERQDIKKSIAAYNAGPGNVKRYDKHPYYGIPPFDETKSYVNLVSRYFLEFEAMNIGK